MRKRERTCEKEVRRRDDRRSMMDGGATVAKRLRGGEVLVARDERHTGESES
jgi:hypothetical protein